MTRKRKGAKVPPAATPPAPKPSKRGKPQPCKLCGVPGHKAPTCPTKNVPDAPGTEARAFPGVQAAPDQSDSVGVSSPEGAATEGTPAEPRSQAETSGVASNPGKEFQKQRAYAFLLLLFTKWGQALEKAGVEQISIDLGMLGIEGGEKILPMPVLTAASLTEAADMWGLFDLGMDKWTTSLVAGALVGVNYGYPTYVLMQRQRAEKARNADIQVVK
jgi:hypothetical protein